MIKLEENYDVVVVGGGLAGVVAALSSARNGARTVIIQNRPVFGGNASSEIKMHICGATMHGKREDSRETGILDEILMENKNKNPNHSFYVFDSILWEKVYLQENLSFHLNTHFLEANYSNNQIKSIRAIQLTSETELIIKGNVFIDATGDGSLSACAGEEFLFGRNDNKYYTKNDDITAKGTMGNTLMYSSLTSDEIYPHEDFKSAKKLSDKELKNRFGFDDPGDSVADEAAAGFWWNELGGEKNVIYDTEAINKDLIRNMFGIYNYTKKSNRMKSEHNNIDWIGYVPAKRESRRIKCLYQLTESDLVTNKNFKDAVAYGGWSMDMHNPLGFLDNEGEPTKHTYLDEVYQIPLSSMVAAKNTNLFVTGRLIDTDSMAFSSTRVMATCAVMGQAVGTAAALLSNKKIKVHDYKQIINDLQITLLENGCFIPNQCLNSKLTENDILEDYPKTLFDGVTRGNYLRLEDNQLSLTLKKCDQFEELILYFDNDLTSEVMPSITRSHKSMQRRTLPEQMPCELRIEVLYENGEFEHHEIHKNLKREIKYKFKNLKVEKIKVVVDSTYSEKKSRVANVYLK